MVCPECLVTTRSGRSLCPTCLEELRAKRAKAKAAAAPEEGEAAEEAFPIPEALPRPQVRPWIASLVVGCVGIITALVFYALGGAVHVSVFLVAVFGVVWALVGLFGRSEQKAHALAGLVLNLVPFFLAFKLGLEAPWITRQQDVEARQIERMSEEEKADLRRQKAEQILRRYRMGQ